MVRKGEKKAIKKPSPPWLLVFNIFSNHPYYSTHHTPSIKDLLSVKLLNVKV